MAIAQIIKAGKVINAIEVEEDAILSSDGIITWPGGEYAPMEDCLLMMQTGAEIGWTLEGETLVAPAAPPPPVVNPVPSSIAIWRAKAVLAETAFTPSSAQTSVQTLLATCTNLGDAAEALVKAQGSAALSSFWASGGDIMRESPALAGIAALLNLSSATVDALFIAAQSIPPL